MDLISHLGRRTDTAEETAGCWIRGKYEQTDALTAAWPEMSGRALCHVQFCAARGSETSRDADKWGGL